MRATFIPLSARPTVLPTCPQNCMSPTNEIILKLRVTGVLLPHEMTVKKARQIPLNTPTEFYSLFRAITMLELLPIAQDKHVPLSRFPTLQAFLQQSRHCTYNVILWLICTILMEWTRNNALYCRATCSCQQYKNSVTAERCFNGEFTSPETTKRAYVFT